MDDKDLILRDLEPLFERAEKEGLWFYSNYQDFWLSPQELKEYQSEGRFVWGAVNWQLRNPYERLNELVGKRHGVENEIEQFKNRIYK